ncbi:MAG: tetratricopeptide repeat protein [Crocosphaera sp.]|nr:tetratricopeptide repeat protein [Crocosphaera sp.]
MKYIDKNKTSLQQLNPSNDALDIYHDSIQTAPDNSWAYLHRGTLYYNQNQYDLAVYDLSQSINLNASYCLAYQFRARVYDSVAELNYNLALQDYSKAIELNGKDISALFRRGNFHARSGNFFQALDDYTKAIQLKPDESLLYNRGVVFYQQNDIERAGEDFRQALAMNPKHIPSLINMGLILYELHQIQAAIECFKKAVSLGQEAEAKLALAVSCFQQNQDDSYKLEKFDKKLLNINYLKDNLWGAKLIQDTEYFLQCKL